jgi:hypothetical protein
MPAKGGRPADRVGQAAFWRSFRSGVGAVVAKLKKQKRSTDAREDLGMANKNRKPAGPEASEGSLKEEAALFRRTLDTLSVRIDKLASDMEKAELREYVNLMHRPWQLIWRNFVSGLSRGIGIALGFTFFAATIVWLLQLLGALNLPVVGDYIADIVRIVQRQLEINPY